MFNNKYEFELSKFIIPNKVKKSTFKIINVHIAKKKNIF